MERNAAHDRASLAVGAAFLLLYALTAHRGLQFADSGELQTVALHGGIPHATGYPLWVLLARAFAWLPLGAPEFRVTLFSAACGAAALALMVRRLGEMGVGLAASVTAACFLGVTFSFWRASVRAEVYTLSALVALAALGAALGAARSLAPAAAGTRADPPGAGAARRAPSARVPLLRAGFLLGLALTVHLAFVPVVAVAGIALAWLAWRGAPRDLARLPLLAGAFALGLAPYLLIPALDAARVPANYLDLVREARAFTGAGGPPLDSPWQGLAWLVIGRNVYPPEPVGFHPRSIAAMLPNAGAALFLFELGPLALPLLVAGLVRHARRARARAALLAAAFLASVGFTAWLQFGAMLHLFALPAILLGAILLADGLDAVFGAVAGASRGAGRAGLAALAAWAALALPPALLRVRAQEHPIGSARWRVIEEDPVFRAGFIPGMQGERDAGRWAREALEAMPRGARVLAAWTHYTPLRHVMLRDGARPDVALRQFSAATLEARVARWRVEPPGERPPLAFVARDRGTAPYLEGADSLALPGGGFVYVLAGPVPIP